MPEAANPYARFTQSPPAPPQAPATDNPYARFVTASPAPDVQDDPEAFLAANPTFPTYMRGTDLQPIGNRRNIPAATEEQRAARAPEAGLGEFARWGSGLAFFMDSIPAMLGDPAARRRQADLNARIATTLGGGNAQPGVGEIMTVAPPDTPASEGASGWFRDEGRNWANAFRFAMDNNELHRAETIRHQYPNSEFRRDERGHLQVRYDRTRPWAYINRPGVSVTDATDLAGTLIRYLPAARASQIPRTLGGRVLTAGGTSGLTEFLSQNLAGAVSGGPGADPNDVFNATLGGSLGQGVFDVALGVAPAIGVATRRALGMPEIPRNPLPDPPTPGSAATDVPRPARSRPDEATRGTPEEIEALETELNGVRERGPAIPRDITDRTTIARQLRDQEDHITLQEGNRQVIDAARAAHAREIADLEARIAAARRPYFDSAPPAAPPAPPPTPAAQAGDRNGTFADEARAVLERIGQKARLNDVFTSLDEGRAGAYIIDSRGSYHRLGQAGHSSWHEQFAAANGGDTRMLGDVLADTGTAEVSTAYKSIGIRIGEWITESQATAISRVMREHPDFRIVLEEVPRGSNTGAAIQGEAEIKRALAAAVERRPRAARAGPLPPAAPPPAPPPPPAAAAEPPLAPAVTAPTSPLNPFERLRRALAAAGEEIRLGRAARAPPQDVDRRAVPRADVRAAFDEQRIPASRAQVTQDVRARQREDDLIQSGEPRALSFADEQAAAINRRAQEIATRGQPAVSGSIDDAGEVVRAELQQQFQQIDDLAGATYDRAFQMLGSVRPRASQDEILRTVDEYLRNGADLEAPLPTGFGLDRLDAYPNPARALRIIEDLQERVAMGTDFADVARVRQALRKLQRDATHNDVEPMLLIRQGYDRWVRDSLRRAQTFRIHSPELVDLAVKDAADRGRAMDLIDEADAIWTERQRMFSARGGRDPAGSTIERLRDPTTQITGTQIINAIFGAGKQPVSQTIGALRRLRAAAQETTPEGRIQPVDAGPTRATEAFNDPQGTLTPSMQALREAFWHRIREPLRKRRPGSLVPARAVAESLDTALNGSHAAITRLLHTPAEIEQMRRLLQVLKYVERPIGVNTSGTAITMRRMAQGAIDGLASALPRGVAFVPRLLGLVVGRGLDDIARGAQANRAFSRPALDVDFGRSPSGAAYGQLDRDNRSDRGSPDPNAPRGVPPAPTGAPTAKPPPAPASASVPGLMSAAAGTITFQDDGYWVTLPTIVDGAQMRPETAIAAWRAGSLGALSMSEDKAEAIAAARAYRAPATAR